MTGFFLNISDRSLLKASNKGKEFADAYMFVKKLASFHKHSIILDFNARSLHYRQKLELTDRKFRKLLNSAIRLNLAYYEGDNLRLRSNTADKREYKQRSTTSVSHNDLHAYYCYVVIKKHITQQNKQIDQKALTVKFANVSCEAVLKDKPYAIFDINNSISLSVRKAADLLGISVSFAHGLLRNLKKFGLLIHQNIIQISKKTFRDCLALNKPNIRYENGIYSYILAQSATWNCFKHSVVNTQKNIKANGIPYYLNDNW